MTKSPTQYGRQINFEEPACSKCQPTLQSTLSINFSGWVALVIVTDWGACSGTGELNYGELAGSNSQQQGHIDRLVDFCKGNGQPVAEVDCKPIEVKGAEVLDCDLSDLSELDGGDEHPFLSRQDQSCGHYRSSFVGISFLPSLHQKPQILA